MDLKNKTILILSPQRWGKMFISKHHYAIALANRGNKVYFLNPPDDPIPAEGGIVIKESGIHQNLKLVEQKLYFPYNLKFHALPVFHLLMRRQVKRVLKKIGEPVDIVWSFEIGHFYPFRFFPENTFKIFHPVDEPLSKEAIDSAEGSHIIFSVTREILDKYAHLSAPRHFINHGLAKEFMTNSQNGTGRPNGIRVGFSGNLLRNDIDRGILLTIVKENPSVTFEFFGSYKPGDSNIGGSVDESQQQFIGQLQSSPNVRLHGAINVQSLATALQGMDMFLICYDVERDQSKGTNYHKVMEYLSTGKTIVSNNITTYKDQPSLVQMIMERNNNEALPALFSRVAANLQEYNGPALQKGRVDFAMDNTYDKQVDRIEKIIMAFSSKSGRTDDR
jgi:hypothetical protein